MWGARRPPPRRPGRRTRAAHDPHHSPRAPLFSANPPRCRAQPCSSCPRRRSAQNISAFDLHSCDFARAIPVLPARMPCRQCDRQACRCTGQMRRRARGPGCAACGRSGGCRRLMDGPCARAGALGTHAAPTWRMTGRRGWPALRRPWGRAGRRRALGPRRCQARAASLGLQPDSRYKCHTDRPCRLVRQPEACR